MEKDALTYGLRARASQLLAWLTGIQQQERQQQTMQTDRQLFDGVTRGMDDPDNRRQVPPLATPSVYEVRMDRQDMRRTVETFAQDAAEQRLALHRREVELGHTPGIDSGSRPRPPQAQARPDPLVAQIEALQQRLQAQQRAQHQGQSRGQGRGW